MKLSKRYQEYMRRREKRLPGFEFKKLKKILMDCSSREVQLERGIDGDLANSTSIQHCPVCERTFFPFLLEEMSAIVSCFNRIVKKLIELHFASGVRRYILWFKGKRRNHEALVQQGKDLVNYVMKHANSIQKNLNKYDKIHCSQQGQAFKSRAQRMHIDILQSPWLYELIAFQINLRDTKANTKTIPEFFEGCLLTLNDGKPSLSWELFDSVKIDIDLTCSICLDTVFDSVSLTCGHIFCYMCACSAASVTIVDGLNAVKPKAKCPICREVRVYEGVVHMKELNILLSQRCKEYWDQRIRTERVERLRQAKEHWESLAFLIIE